MRKAALMLAAGVMLMTLGVGCGGGGADHEDKMAVKYGTTVASFDKGGTPEMTKAPFDGMYYLHTTTPEGKPTSKVPTWQMTLKQGDSIGFKPSENSEAAVVAVAGDKMRAVPNMTYRWLYKAPR